MSLTGGAPEVVAHGPLFPGEFEARAHLFWLEQGIGSCDGRVVRAGLDGSGAQTLAKACWPYAIASDDQHVYYLEIVGANLSTLRRAPL